MAATPFSERMLEAQRDWTRRSPVRGVAARDRYCADVERGLLCATNPPAPSPNGEAGPHHRCRKCGSRSVLVITKQLRRPGKGRARLRRRPLPADGRTREPRRSAPVGSVGTPRG